MCYGPTNTSSFDMDVSMVDPGDARKRELEMIERHIEYLLVHRCLRYDWEAVKLICSLLIDIF
jgi:hypothetical protein